jgi:HEAT repeat protein
MTKFLRPLLVSAAALALGSISSSARADDDPSTHAGRATVYQNLQDNSLETVSTPEVIRSLFDSQGNLNFAPTRVWAVLEHGEKIECLSCIPLVAGLLYDSHDKTREIAAWWLRRRIFGVFGPGEVYSQVIATLADSTQPETTRSRAANALGEFLTLDGAKYLATALRNDTSAVVRQASVQALQRMNTEGPNEEIAFAMGDTDSSVRLAAVVASTRVNVFTNVAAIAGLVGDPEATVRQAAAAALGTMRVKDAVDSLVFLSSAANEPDASVRKSAVWSLGQIQDGSALDAVVAAQNDPNPFVQDAARIATIALGGAVN